MIDLRSDTVTRPSEDMREAAATADVGDDVHHDDPTVEELESRAADLLGTEAALYCPSGTMANQVAARTHTDHGQEVLVERESHIYRWELGGLAQLSGLQVRTIDAGPRGVVTPDQVRSGHVEADSHRPGTGLLCLENTHNARGGTAIGPGEIDAAARAAHDLGVPVHVDGARLANAAVAHEVPVARYSEVADSVMLALSKGLGAPVGSVLGGSADFVERARRERKLLGGGMRQAGVIAAPGLLALENVDRLATDHENAARLADGLSGIEGLSLDAPETNIVYVDVSGTGLAAGTFAGRIESAGVRCSQYDERTVRFCTHLDVDETDVGEAVERIDGALSG